jgi:hypothetical protein
MKPLAMKKMSERQRMKIVIVMPIYIAVMTKRESLRYLKQEL